MVLKLGLHMPHFLHIYVIIHTRAVRFDISIRLYVCTYLCTCDSLTYVLFKIPICIVFTHMCTYIHTYVLYHPVLVCWQVSRCGMIYLEPHMLGWEPVHRSWANTLPPTLTEENKTLISSLYKRFVPACIDFVRKAGFKVRVYLYSCIHGCYYIRKML